MSSLTVPASVTILGVQAFSYCTGLTNVTLMNGIPSIGASAFQACAGLATVAIPDSVTNIGSRAFSGCTGLTNVVIGAHASSISPDAFVDCSSLVAITVSAQNAFYNSLNGVLFNKTQSILVEFPPGLGTSYDIPTGGFEAGVVIALRADFEFFPHARAVFSIIETVRVNKPAGLFAAPFASSMRVAAHALPPFSECGFELFHGGDTHSDRANAGCRRNDRGWVALDGRGLIAAKARYGRQDP